MGIVTSIAAGALGTAAGSAAATGQGNGFLTSFLGFPTLNDLLLQIVAYLANTVLGFTSWLVAISGTLLNVSITITLHIKDFVDSTPAIYQVWAAIRDISGIFIIFFLLYAAFKLILGQDAKLGELVKNIVIAGVVINFSFFITSVLIDASNMVSLTIYHSMLPANLDNNMAQNIRGKNLVGLASASLNDGGLSAIFMQNLQIQSLYNENGLTQTGIALNTSSNTNKYLGAPLKIILIAGIGVFIMIAAAASFTLAAGAFVVRLVILLLLLAFSPIFWAASIVPEIDKQAKQWKEILVSQLIFMPAYLLLMYVALAILNGGVTGANSGFLGTGFVGNLWKGNTNIAGTDFIVLAINFAIVIIMLNIPLVAAISLGGKATGWISKNNWSPGALWKRFGDSTRRNTYGRVASAVARSENLQAFAARTKVGELALKGVRNVAADYNKVTEAQLKSRNEFADSLGFNQGKMNAAQQQLRLAQSNLASAKARGVTGRALDTFESAVGNAKRDISAVESNRKVAYAERIGSRTLGIIGSADTLLTMVGRRNKLASAKIQIPVIEKQLTARKDSLKDTQSDIKSLTNAIRNNPAVGLTPAGTPTLAQSTELSRLQNDESHKLYGVNSRGTPTDPAQGSVNFLEQQLEALKSMK